VITQEKICAIIVTFNCKETIHGNINTLMSQVGHVVAIDNGSDIEALEILQIYSNNKKFTLILNDDNKGIASALNQGLDFALKNSYDLILTLDQDSFLRNNSVQKMLEVLNCNKSIVSVGPNFNNKFRIESEFIYTETLIASGNLTYTKIAKRVGGFREGLFIDCVDLFFSFDLRNDNKQNKLAIIRDAKMDHELGELEKGKFLIFKKNICVHNPERYYYMSRNSCYLVKEYKNKFKKSVYIIKAKYIKDFLIILLFDKRKRLNLSMMMKGINDSKKNKYGKMI
jgi:rhamnosyltransferase